MWILTIWQLGVCLACLFVAFVLYNLSWDEQWDRTDDEEGIQQVIGICSRLCCIMRCLTLNLFGGHGAPEKSDEPVHKMAEVLWPWFRSFANAGYDLTPSDFYAAMGLLRVYQNRERKREGVKPVTEPVMESLRDSVSRLGSGLGQDRAKRHISSTPTAISPMDPLSRNHQELESEQIVLEETLHSDQTILDPQEMREAPLLEDAIREAAHFMPYALSMFGWMIYLYMNLKPTCSSGPCCWCRLCHCKCSDCCVNEDGPVVHGDCTGLQEEGAKVILEGGEVAGELLYANFKVHPPLDHYFTQILPFTHAFDYSRSRLCVLRGASCSIMRPRRW